MILQLMLVAILIFWPGMVTMWLDKEVAVDLDKVKIEVQSVDDPDPKEAAPGGAAPGKEGETQGAAGKPADGKPAEEEDLGKLLQKQIQEDAQKAAK